MTPFPVSNSTLSATHLVAFLQEKYALSPSTQCKLIRAGLNDTYLVTDKLERFVFRVYSLNWRTRTEIVEEVNLLLKLQENDIPVSYPLADKTSNFIQEVNAPEGVRFAVLFTYAAGEKLHDYSAETHFQIGTLMAQFHQITLHQKIKRVDYSAQVILKDSLKHIANFLGADTAEMKFMLDTHKELIQEFKNVDASKLRTGIVHLDIWFDNINLTKNNKATLFDFDFCGNGWLCLDIAYYIMQLHNIEKYDKTAYQTKIDSFLKGYESITKLSTEEKRLIPILGVSLYYFYLGVQCQRYENWSNSFLSENYLKRYINGLVKRYYELYR